MKHKRKRRQENYAVTVLQIGFMIFGLELFIFGNEMVSSFGFVVMTFALLIAISTNVDFNPACADRGGDGQKAI